MTRNKEFIKNTIILFVGKFATQSMSLILLPLFTHYLLAEDYGIVDLLQTYMTLFIPILTFRIDSAVFRFLLDKREDEDGKRKIITNILALLMVGIIITIILFYIFVNFIKIQYASYVIINLMALMTSSILLQMLRGLGKNKEYSIASIITGVTTLIINILLIVIFNRNAESILISSTIANLLCIIYTIIVIKLFRYIEIKLIDKEEIKSILKYSFPMIPNALSWWIVNVSDRTIISMFLGVTFNGIYTVSCKFSNILNNVYSIFNMSWQETASLHINDEDKNQFFSNIINKLFMLFSSVSILIIAVLPFVYDKLIGIEYISSFKYIPILLYANSWNVLIGLIGGIYVAKKKTKEIANTTIASAIINIIINLLLIKHIGIYAACISTLISYMVVGIYRYIDCQKYVNLKLDIKNIVVFTILFITSSMMYLSNSIIVNIINLLIISIYVMTINKEIIVKGLKLVRQRSQKIKKIKEI